MSSHRVVGILVRLYGANSYVIFYLFKKKSFFIMLVLSRINIIVSSFCMLVFMLFGTHDHYQCFSEVSGTTSVGYYVICCWVNLLAISVVILLCSVCGESLPVSLLSTALWFTSIIRIVPV